MTRDEREGFPFDAVLFDLDGTLVATDRFWPDAARAGALRAFEELGIRREPPSRAAWMGMVGSPLEEAFAEEFADLDPVSRARVMELCVEEEHAALRAGHAVLLPGAQAALEELRARGVRLGIASNCGRDYLNAMLQGLGLERWIEEPRCLDSPGIACKADMIQDLLWTFDTRSAVMVGDRISDRDAAWENGLPHVHLARGFAEAGEVNRCEAAIEGLDQLLPRLFGRWRLVDGCIAELDLMGEEALVLTGPRGSGKSLLARDLCRRLDRTGRGARVVALDGASSEELDVRSELERSRVKGELTVFEGRGLEPLLAQGFAGPTLVLEVDEAVARRRLAGRDARLGGPDRYRLRVEEALAQGQAPTLLPGGRVLRVDGNNALGPLS